MKIDKDGLILCELQGNLFASSAKYLKSSSEIFMRRFMNSSIVHEFDSLAVLNDSLTIESIFNILNDEFGETTYGRIIYNTEVLFWIGYIYRYISYVYEIPSKRAYKIIKPKELKDLYYVYHTFDCKEAIERILESKGINLDPSKQNELLLKLIRRKKYEQGINLSNVTDNVISLNDKSIIKYEDKITNKHLIIYNNEIIGEIVLSEINNKCFISIKIFEDKNMNKGIGNVSLLKMIDYIKKHNLYYEIYANINKTDSKSIYLFKKNGFVYESETNTTANYILKIKS